MTAVEFTRWFLALFFAGVAGFYAVRVMAIKRQGRESPVFVGTVASRHWVAHLVFRLFRVLILSACIARLIWPGTDTLLLPFSNLWHSAVLMIGNVLLLTGFALVVFLHFYMGSSWRSGTRAEDRTRLITTGPFAASRNPMMLSVMVGQVGFFLALPSVFTLVCLIVGIGAVVAQVSVEEDLLRQRFGDDYESYALRTPRWLLR